MSHWACGEIFVGFRENMDLEKAYMQGRFDAIPYIDESERKHYR